MAQSKGAGSPNLVHGHGYGTPTYRTWRRMRFYCECPQSDRYSDYGGRGITVCPEWASFEAFLSDMGERPDGMTLDRRDNDQGYNPENCRWATPQEQARNRRNNRKVLLNGEDRLLVELCAELGVKYQTAYARLNRGLTPEQALGLSPLPPRRRRRPLNASTFPQREP